MTSKTKIQFLNVCLMLLLIFLLAIFMQGYCLATQDEATRSDTLKVSSGKTLWLKDGSQTTFSGAATITGQAGASMTFAAGSDMDFSHGRIDSLAVDSLTALGPSFFGGDIEFAGSVATLARKFTGTAGSDIDVTHLRADTLAVDSLTVTGLAAVVGDLAGTGTTTLDTLTATGPTSIPADSSTLSLPSVLLSAESAYKVIRFDLTDQAQMWNLAEFESKAKEKSWYRTSTDTTNFHPRHGYAAITTGQDSIALRDTDRNKEWMVFLPGANNIVQDATPVLTCIKWKDGKLWFGGTGSADVTVVDFMADAAYKWDTGGFQIYKGAISERNDGLGWLTLDASSAIVNASVNAVSVIRDPEGSTDSFDRPQHIVLVGTDGGPSLSNAGITMFYDEHDPEDADFLVLLPAGDALYHRDYASFDLVCWRYSVQTVSADGWDDETATQWYNTQSGSQDIPWANAAVFSDVVAIPNASVTAIGSPILLFSSQYGIIGSHAKREDNTNGLTYMINDVRNVGPWSSAVIDNFTLQDTLGAFGKSLTRSGAGVTFSDSGAVFDGTDYMYLHEDTDLRLMNGDCTIMSFFRAAGGGAGAYILHFRSGGAQVYIVADDVTDDGLDFYVMDDNQGEGDVIDFTNDVMDSRWHHAAFTRETNRLKAYVDGEYVGGTTFSETDVSTDTLMVGASADGANQLTGMVWQLNLIDGRALADKEIRHEYQRGMAMLDRMRNGVSQTFTKVIVSLDVDERSGLVVAASAGSLAVIDPNLMVILEKRASTVGTLKDVAITTYAGSDSISIVQGGSTGVDLSQPDPLVANAAGGSGPSQTLWSPTIYNPVMLGPSAATPTGWAVVDSAGHGHFTHPNQATEAGYRRIFIAKGTYTTRMDCGTAGVLYQGINNQDAIFSTTAGAACSIYAANVTIRDLGFKTPAGGGVDPAHGIQIMGTGDSTHVIDCFVSGSDNVGINMMPGCDGSVIEGCVVNDADAYGILARGAGTRIRNCMTSNCGSTGFILTTDLYIGVVDCSSHNSAGRGFMLGSPFSLLVGSLSNASGDDGIWIQATGDSSLVDGNLITGWTNEAIDDDATGCTVGDNMVLTR